jgi:rare lipoprotein A
MGGVSSAELRGAFAVLIAFACGVACRTTSDEGVASYYADLLQGRPTASGAPYDPRRDTCAHRTLPFGTVVEIEVVATGRTARCVVNDRGPFAKNRIIDVSRAVAEKLGFFGAKGIAKVRIRIVQR